MFEKVVRDASIQTREWSTRILVYADNIDIIVNLGNTVKMFSIFKTVASKVGFQLNKEKKNTIKIN